MATMVAAGAVRLSTNHSRSFRVQRYSAPLKKDWDAFINQAHNATFLFHRDYMEYHADRFDDHSLMVYRGSELVAVLPANLDRSGMLISHAGLTYGGLVMPRHTTLSQTLAVFYSLLRYLHHDGIATLRYKRIPGFYSRTPDDDLGYCMFLVEARLQRRECSLVVSLAAPLPLQKRRGRQVKKARRARLSIREDTSFDAFWNNVLIPRLSQRYAVKPVHTVAEISLLASRFPDNIKQFSVYDGDEILAGITIYETPAVAHSQYIAATDKGRKLGALDYLINWFLAERYRSKDFFDFGCSTEQEGRAVNHGLLEWKEGFGARCFSHDFYDIRTANYSRLEPVLAGTAFAPAQLDSPASAAIVV